MNPNTWDFSKYGIASGLQKFGASFLKTGGVALASYALLKLNSVHVPATATHYVEVYTTGLVFLRALISGFLEWVNTHPGDVMPVAEPVVTNESAVPSIG